MDAIMIYVNSLDSEGLTKKKLRSLIYAKAMSLPNDTR